MKMKRRFTAVLLYIYLGLTFADGKFLHHEEFPNTLKFPTQRNPIWTNYPFQANLYYGSKTRREWKTPFKNKLMQGPFLEKDGGASCDGKSNLVTDLGLLAIITGVVDTLLSFYSTNYTSIFSNAVSVINVFFSFAFGIPSAILTYLAASDRVSYTLGNVLSMLSFANTFYGIWSIDFGNQDIFTSSISNMIGLFSLTLSIASAFPSLVDDTIDLIGSVTGNRRIVNQFVNTYGCSSNELTLYVTLKTLNTFINKL